MDGRTSGVKYQKFDFGDCGTSFSEMKSATCNMREISGSTVVTSIDGIPVVSLNVMNNPAGWPYTNTGLHDM